MLAFAYKNYDMAEYWDTTIPSGSNFCFCVSWQNTEVDSNLNYTTITGQCGFLTVLWIMSDWIRIYRLLSDLY